MTKSAIPCEVCGNSEVEVIGNCDRNKKPLRTVICTKCGLVWVDPRPNQNELANFYSDEYRKSYKGAFEPKPKHCYRETKRAIGRVWRLMSVYKNGDSVLDIGAGAGFFPLVLSMLNIVIDGIEPNKKYAEFARENLKLQTVYTGFLADVKHENHYDIITINHVFEHLDRPRESLKYMRSMLKEQGRIIMEVPNIEATYHSPDKIFHIGHLYWYNPVTISALAVREGFVVEDVAIVEGTQHINLILQKSIQLSVSEIDYGKNFANVKNILLKHTKTRHYFTSVPYRRLYGKILQYYREYKATSGKKCSDICEEIIQDWIEYRNSKSPLG